MCLTAHHYDSAQNVNLFQFVAFTLKTRDGNVILM